MNRAQFSAALESTAPDSVPVHAYCAGDYVDLSSLPRRCAGWTDLRSTDHGQFATQANESSPLHEQHVARYIQRRAWVWPAQPIYFFCDLHADADAFLRSLCAAGLIAKTGPEDTQYNLTPAAREGRIIIGGDCLDKGPQNLRLLEVLGSLIAAGLEVEILAGNHDLRALVGFEHMGRKEPLFAHLFLRMGKKSIPLFREILDYIALHPELAQANAAPPLSEKELEATLFPDATWWSTFPVAARGVLPDAAIEKELRRIREKREEFSARLAIEGLSLQDAYLAAHYFSILFLRDDGPFSWFYRKMTIAAQHGSLLFVHAGVCDQSANWLREGGISGLRSRYQTLRSHDSFALYHGALGNMFRTKYRDNDQPLTLAGLRDLRAAGVHAIVHGHRNVTDGQRLVMRQGVLNFECDASLDAHTRKVEGLETPGSAVTIFRPDGCVLGISSDADFVKMVDFRRYARWLVSRPLDPCS